MNRILSLALLTTLLVSPAAARADILYGMDNGVLTRIDTDTLTATPIGDSGIFALAGLEFGPGGQLFGVDQDKDRLVRIDTATGIATSVGSFNISVSRSTGLGWDHTTNQMYGTATLSGSPDYLTNINLDNGSATYVVGLDDIRGNRIVGLNFDYSGNLYGIQAEVVLNSGR